MLLREWNSLPLNLFFLSSCFSLILFHFIYQQNAFIAYKRVACLQNQFVWHPLCNISFAIVCICCNTIWYCLWPSVLKIMNNSNWYLWTGDWIVVRLSNLVVAYSGLLCIGSETAKKARVFNWGKLYFHEAASLFTHSTLPHCCVCFIHKSRHTVCTRQTK